MEDFVTYEIAVKLKEKGFTCEYPFAMYTEYEQFCPLYSSDRYYFGIDDFDKHDYIAPTISQVFKWLREVKGIHIDIAIWKSQYIAMIVFIDKPDQNIEHYNETIWEDERLFDTYEKAAIAGIEYVLNNLI